METGFDLDFIADAFLTLISGTGFEKNSAAKKENLMAIAITPNGRLWVRAILNSACQTEDLFVVWDLILEKSHALGCSANGLLEYVQLLKNRGARADQVYKLIEKLQSSEQLKYSLFFLSRYDLMLGWERDWAVDFKAAEAIRGYNKG